jgi:hypothetical protein
MAIMKRLSIYMLLTALLAGALIACDTTKPKGIITASCEHLEMGCNIDDIHVQTDRAPTIMRHFKLNVQAPGADEVYASFAMEGMEMGLNRYRLLAGDADDWYADVTLPVCARARLDWLLKLDVRAKGTVSQYQLTFTSELASRQAARSYWSD